jgi:hypothetical protein
MKSFFVSLLVAASSAIKVNIDSDIVSQAMKHANSTSMAKIKDEL